MSRRRPNRIDRSVDAGIDEKESWPVSTVHYRAEVQELLKAFSWIIEYSDADRIETLRQKQQALLANGEPRLLVVGATTAHVAVAVVNTRLGSASRAERGPRDHLERYVDHPRTLIALAALERGHANLDRLFGFVGEKLINLRYMTERTRMPSREEVEERRTIARGMLQDAVTHRHPERQSVLDRAAAVFDVVEAMFPDNQNVHNLPEDSRKELRTLAMRAPESLTDAAALVCLATDMSDEAADKGWNLILSLAPSASSEEISRAVSKLASQGERQLVMAHRLETSREFLTPEGGSGRRHAQRGLARWTSRLGVGRQSNVPQLNPENEAEFLRAYAKHQFGESLRRVRSRDTARARGPASEQVIVVGGGGYSADDVLFALRERMKAAVQGGDFDHQLDLDAKGTELNVVDSGVIRIVAGVDVALTSKMFSAVTQSDDLDLAAPIDTLLTADANALGPLAAFVRDRHIEAVETGRRRTSALVELVSRSEHVATERDAESRDLQETASVVDATADHLANDPTQPATESMGETAAETGATGRLVQQSRRPPRRTALPSLTTDRTTADHELTSPSFLARRGVVDGSVEPPNELSVDDAVLPGGDVLDVPETEGRGLTDL